ncbi:putative ATP-dependent endonuclease of OLD family [Yokenella regensburgei]|uniref:ATP-dependent endonuclease of OLD family n=1 Tax=Yokenella regensburgei TaxID=158877 RepID=A0ABX9RSH6_9ENTR|nr:ATP-binding protein [Yokenella regensburgei]RKR52951.1 putative ATP-dependent endonuclease of OLD family [Yokenella regensburgei]VFS33152.1 Predicted ATP-binding protein involved in virulence [Yokenella regensburgei]
MKLEQVIIKNFRCYRNPISISIDALTAIIARNDVGKSSILEALDAFFNSDKLEPGDRSCGLRSTDSIEITCIFGEIPNQLIVDTDNLISPMNEYLLNNNNKLQIKKVYSGASPKCEHVYIHAFHPTAENFNDLFSLTVAELKRRARELNVDLNNVNQTIKSALRHSIWLSVPSENLQKQMVDLEIKSTIWKPLQNILPLYQLFKSDRPSSDQDAEAQDPIKFAIKEALKQKAAELDIIGIHVKNQVEEVTRLTIEKIREMDPDLASQLNPEFSSFNWSKVFSVSLTNENQIPLNKRGSGVRRLFLINFFRAKAEQLADERDVQDVIFAIEEPETSQHPNNQLLLLDAIKELSLESSNQVIFTTHNPVLAGRIDKESIRYIEKNADGVRGLSEINEETLQKIKSSLGMFANHNIKAFIGVEGPNDIEFMNRISARLALEDPTIIDLRNAEQQGELVYIPMGGSTLELWTNRLEGLQVPEVHVLDRDTPPPGQAKYQEAADRVNARGNHCSSFITNKREMENYIHYEAINIEFGLQLTENYNDFDDVPTLVAIAVHEASGSDTVWDDLDEKKKAKKESKAKKRLNRGAIDNMNLARLANIDPNSEVLDWLRRINIHLQ